MVERALARTSLSNAPATSLDACRGVHYQRERSLSKRERSLHQRERDLYIKEREIFIIIKEREIPGFIIKERERSLLTTYWSESTLSS